VAAVSAVGYTLYNHVYKKPDQTNAINKDDTELSQLCLLIDKQGKQLSEATRAMKEVSLTVSEYIQKQGNDKKSIMEIKHEIKALNNLLSSNEETTQHTASTGFPAITLESNKETSNAQNTALKQNTEVEMEEIAENEKKCMEGIVGPLRALRNICPANGASLKEIVQFISMCISNIVSKFRIHCHINIYIYIYIYIY
jgi:hypothetical protein